MTALKSTFETVKKWPTWVKITAAVFAFGAFNAIVNPKPMMTSEQKAAYAEQEKAKDAERSRAKLETETVFAAHQWLKENLNDPDSVEWLGTFIYPNMDICINFSANNAMGGRVKGYAAVIGGKLTINDVKAWNKRCGDGGAVRYY